MELHAAPVEADQECPVIKMKVVTCVLVLCTTITGHFRIVRFRVPRSVRFIVQVHKGVRLVPYCYTSTDTTGRNSSRQQKSKALASAAAATPLKKSIHFVSPFPVFDSVHGHKTNTAKYQIYIIIADIKRILLRYNNLCTNRIIN